MQYTTYLKNLYFHLSEDCVGYVFPNFVACCSRLYQTHSELLSSEESNSMLRLGIYFVFILDNNTVLFRNFLQKL